MLVPDLPDDLEYNFPEPHQQPDGIITLNLDDQRELYLELNLWVQVERFWWHVCCDRQSSPGEFEFIMQHIQLLLQDYPEWRKEYWSVDRLPGGPYAFDNPSAVTAMFCESEKPNVASKAQSLMRTRCNYEYSASKMALPDWFVRSDNKWIAKFVAEKE